MLVKVTAGCQESVPTMLPMCSLTLHREALNYFFFECKPRRQRMFESQDGAHGVGALHRSVDQIGNAHVEHDLKLVAC